MTPKKPLKSLNVRISEQLLIRVKKSAIDEDVAVQALVAAALEEYLKPEAKKARKLASKQAELPLS